MGFLKIKQKCLLAYLPCTNCSVRRLLCIQNRKLTFASGNVDAILIAIF